MTLIVFLDERYTYPAYNVIYTQPLKSHLLYIKSYLLYTRGRVVIA